MATITLEVGKKNKKGVHPVSFLLRHNSEKKRIPSGISVSDSELSANGKTVRNQTKARQLEMMRRKLEDKLYDMSVDLLGSTVDSGYIVERLKAKPGAGDFFEFTYGWLETSKLKGARNYVTMLRQLELFNQGRILPFRNITFDYLTRFERFLDGKPRAQSLYLGIFRKLYREAMRTYNTDVEQVIANDPFTRYRVPKMTVIKGVRSLTLDDLLKIYRYEAPPGGRAQLARDCFILSFCLMGMNSVDLYECKTIKRGVISYERAKTRDRRSLRP